MKLRGSFRDNSDFSGAADQLGFFYYDYANAKMYLGG